MKLVLVIIVNVLSFAAALPAAEGKTRNLFLIMNDGVRWQEIFMGADESLLNKNGGSAADVKKLRASFWQETADERRKALSPFLWNEIASQGQIFGNQKLGSVARTQNSQKKSYPGYSETFTGFVDPRIDSNKKILNNNVTLFEWFNGRPGFKGQVATAAAWDVFPYIFNAGRSGLPVWPGWEARFEKNAIRAPRAVEVSLRENPPPWSTVVFDSAVHEVAVDYVKRAQPRLMFIGFGEADEWAHEGRYGSYLEAIQNADRFVRSLWNTIQAMPQYRDQTTLVLTTDHGRGIGSKDWREHGEKISHSEEVWMAVMGPDTPSLGERTNSSPITLSQVAATIGVLLGENYRTAFPKAASPIADVMARP